MEESKIKKAVQESYASIAVKESSCCSPVNLCCGGSDFVYDISRKIGYSDEELKAVPKGANLGLGCGNPVALASLKMGESVLDLGSGAGFDCFLAADKVGTEGKVIGVDMTLEMLEKARKNAEKGNYPNVEFRLGEIENIPVHDNTVDAVISNCVINLSPDKNCVFKEAFRVLKPGGRLMVSDIVLLKELPEELRNSIDAYIGCMAGAILKDEYLEAIQNAGFHDVQIFDETQFAVDLMANDPIVKMMVNTLNIPFETIKEVNESIVSLKVRGYKPD
ncbi:MAG TPA: arsenite methyltransferase [archaeon]|nr:arsenite methyltransferase [archaeon]